MCVVSPCLPALKSPPDLRWHGLCAGSVRRPRFPLLANNMEKGVDCFSQEPFTYFTEDALMLGTNTDGDLTKYEECLKHMQKKSIPQFLKNNGLQHLVTNPELAASVCRYLLYVVSCHSDLVVVNAAANTLLYHVESGVCFAPDRSQILAIAMNMGGPVYIRAAAVEWPLLD
ncbi:uncharacterized protein LOC119092825 [Pollicipes pollicipes]|uniref:uncharacterized protein LOC119092825 n=1 Tax=Pollicipes pollicipes TaxID=41117 RepID=UPI001885606A|nr:uncharacterized protein LOC119092825 [Pollicipes pollicipes]